LYGIGVVREAPPEEQIFSKLRPAASHAFSPLARNIFVYFFTPNPFAPFLKFLFLVHAPRLLLE